VSLNPSSPSEASLKVRFKELDSRLAKVEVGVDDPNMPAIWW
jgi:hypothetical protein